MSDLVNKEDTSNVSIPSGWVFAEFDETCKPVSDRGRKVPQKAYLKSGRYPIVDQGEEVIGGFTNDASMLFHGEMPVIAFGDHTRRFKLVDWPFVVGADGVKLIGLTSTWNPKCLWYFLRALKFEDRGYSRHFQFLRKARLPLPPLPEQSRIADALDELLSDLDAAVATLERIREKLKLYRASVLKAAVEGALTAEWRVQHPHTEPARELLNRILAERRRRWEEDQLPKFKAKGQQPPKDWKAKYKEPVAPSTANLPRLPEGWCWASVDQLTCEVRNGHSLKPDAASGVPILRISAVRPFALDMNDVRYLSGTASDYSESLIHSCDLLFTRYNGTRSLVGVCAIVPEINKAIVHPDKLIRARPLPAVAVPAFVALTANVGASRAFIEQRIRTTAGQAGVSGSDIKELPIPLPPSAEQEAIVEAVEDQLSVIDHLEADLDAKLKNAHALRQAILRHAFTGRLVPQDPNEEPASELLKRIAAEREARASAGKADGVRKRMRRASRGGRLPA